MWLGKGRSIGESHDPSPPPRARKGARAWESPSPKSPALSTPSPQRRAETDIGENKQYRRRRVAQSSLALQCQTSHACKTLSSSYFSKYRLPILRLLCFSSQKGEFLSQESKTSLSVRHQRRLSDAEAF